MKIFAATLFYILLFLFIPNHLISQTKVQYYSVKKQCVISPKEMQDNWLLNIQNLEIIESNIEYKKYFAAQKNIVNKKYANIRMSEYVGNGLHHADIDTPKVSYGFMGNAYSNSAPNDNTMAISNDGIIVSSINTNIIFYDTKEDTLLKKMSLRFFSKSLAGISTHQYDPKAIYDYKNDRFILVYLAGSGNSGSSHIIVAFSSSNNPLDDWYLYAIEGNPFNDNSWTDYPALSLSNNELFITGNLIKVGGGSWQTSFKQSLIWQIDKQLGFDGDELDFAIYSDINYKGIPCRNIHPVRGGNKFYGPEMYFLSERNFDIHNDTFFLMKIDKYLSEGDLDLSVKPIISDYSYGMPPNALQPNLTDSLATNDSRVLGAFFHDNKIQFVGNSVDYLTGHSSFYHGIMDLNMPNIYVHLNIFSDSLLEYGYPNLSFCGVTPESQQSIISYNYTSYKTFPGMAAFIYKGSDDGYSMPINIKSGTASIQVLNGNQRWGDYSASQPMYNKAGQVWVAATFGRQWYSKKVYGTWIAALNSQLTDEVDVAEGEDISSAVYPNPVSDNIAVVEFNLKEKTVIIIEVVDVYGKHIDRLYNQEALRGRNRVSLSTLSLSNGIYFVVIKTENEILETHKISVLN